MQNPYRKAQEAAVLQRGTRELERDLLMRVSRSLKEAVAAGDRMALVKAVTDNQTLWQVFVSDVLGPNNQLPQALRAQIASVGLAVIREMNDNLHGDLDVAFLLDVNESFIAGLGGRS